STMSGGEQKQLEVGRALLLRPRVLLIDEPSIGLSAILVQGVMTLLRQLADAGTTVLMVEQNVRTALKYANRALVLEMGRLALDRPASELLHDANLNRLFLGGHVKSAAAALWLACGLLGPLRRPCHRVGPDRRRGAARRHATSAYTRMT